MIDEGMKSRLLLLTATALLLTPTAKADPCGGCWGFTASTAPISTAPAPAPTPAPTSSTSATAQP